MKEFILVFILLLSATAQAGDGYDFLKTFNGEWESFGGAGKNFLSNSFYLVQKSS